MIDIKNHKFATTIALLANVNKCRDFKALLNLESHGLTASCLPLLHPPHSDESSTAMYSRKAA
mgnify:CR=1 FL=1